METRELKINVPDGYEIDRENSTFECIKFKRKSLTYNDVAEELFYHKESFYITCTDIWRQNDTLIYTNCLAKSFKQFEKLFAINKLMNVAKYLNGDWKPDWLSDNKKYFIGESKGKIYISNIAKYNRSIVYFKTEELAQQAIDILGEDTIRLALSTDW